MKTMSVKDVTLQNLLNTYYGDVDGQSWPGKIIIVIS